MSPRVSDGDMEIARNSVQRGVRQFAEEIDRLRSHNRELTEQRDKARCEMEAAHAGWRVNLERAVAAESHNRELREALREASIELDPEYARGICRRALAPDSEPK